MIFCKERDVISFSTRNSIIVEKSKCPVDGKTERQNTKELINILEKSYPDIKQKIMGAMQRSNIDKWGLN